MKPSYFYELVSGAEQRPHCAHSFTDNRDIRSAFPVLILSYPDAIYYEAI